MNKKTIQPGDKNEPMWSPLIHAWVYPPSYGVDPVTGEKSHVPALVWNDATKMWEVLNEAYAQRVFHTSSSQSQQNEHHVSSSQFDSRDEEESLANNALQEENHDESHDDLRDKQYEENRNGDTTTTADEQEDDEAASINKEDASLNSAAYDKASEVSSDTNGSLPLKDHEETPHDASHTYPADADRDNFEDSHISLTTKEETHNSINNDAFNVFELVDVGEEEPHAHDHSESSYENGSQLPGQEDPLVIRIDTPVVVGRKPRELPALQARLVSISDPVKSLSKTHALFMNTDAGLVITDLGSTNGTWIVFPDGSRQDVMGDSAVLASEKSYVHMGKRVFFIRRSQR